MGGQIALSSLICAPWTLSLKKIRRPRRRSRLLGIPNAVDLMGFDHRAVRGPDIDRAEQEQPDHVDEVPVPGGRLEAEVLLGGEVTAYRAHQADEKEDGADDDVEAVEAGRHEESG